MHDLVPDVATRLTLSPLEQYRAFLVQGKLACQVDEDGRALFYPRVAAPAGYRGNLRWAISAGLGTVYATTIISPRQGPSYNVALIDMDEGFRLMSRVESVAPEDVSIGMRVKVRIQASDDDEGPFPVFDPVESLL